MSIRKEQCKKVCRILADVLANRPTERDSLIVAVQLAFEAQPEPHWIPVTERLPIKSDDYLVSTNDKCVFDLYFSTEHGWDGWWNGRICAWMQKPEPYEGRTE